MRRHITAAVGLLLGALACSASAQGWPSADCPALLSGGHPRPAWGSKEKLTQEGLLMMINYQLAVGACQQDEMLKLMRQQTATAKAEPKAEPKARAEPAKPAGPNSLFPAPFPGLEGLPFPRLEPSAKLLAD